MDKINITFDYDETGDILYISLGTNEPSYCEEIDDVLLLERGYFSHQITGFQLINVKHHGINKVEVGRIVKKAIKQEKSELQSRLEQRMGLPGLIEKNLSRHKKYKRLLQEA